MLKRLAWWLLLILTLCAYGFDGGCDNGGGGEAVGDASTPAFNVGTFGTAKFQ